MTEILATAALVILGWLGLSVATYVAWYWFLAPRRAEREYRRWMR